jgi:Barrel-sandwich domain of CusB or HlyD membrane-fusion
MKRFMTLSMALLAAGCLFFASIDCTKENETGHEGHDHSVAETTTDDHEHGAECDHDADPVAAFLAADLSAGGTDDGEDHAHGDACITLGDVGSANLGIATQVLQSELYYDQIKIPGTLAADPDRVVEISAPALVRVISLSATPPAVVQPGERLAVLELADPEVRSLQMEAVKTRADLMAAELELARQERYLESLKTGSPQGSELNRVRAEVQISHARMQAERSALAAQLASLKVAGLSKTQLAALEADGTVATRIEVFAPSLPQSPSLEVADRPISLGETIGAGETLFSLVALDELRVIGEAFEADVPYVRNALRERLPVSLLFPAAGCMVKDLSIEALEGALDGVNRVTHFFVRLPNPVLSERTARGLHYQERRHSAGSRVQIMVATQEKGERFVIPSSALVPEGGEVYAFVQEQGGYERIAIKAESIDGRLAVLPLDGHLQPGTVLVIQGALQLNLLWHEQNSSGATTVDPHAGHNH